MLHPDPRRTETISVHPEPGPTEIMHPLEGITRPRDAQESPRLGQFIRELRREAEHVFAQKFTTKAQFIRFIGKTIPIDYAGVRFYITVHADDSKTVAGIRPSDMHSEFYKRHKDTIDHDVAGILRGILGEYYTKLPQR